MGRKCIYYLITVYDGRWSFELACPTKAEAEAQFQELILLSPERKIEVHVMFSPRGNMDNEENEDWEMRKMLEYIPSKED